MLIGCGADATPFELIATAASWIVTAGCPSASTGLIEMFPLLLGAVGFGDSTVGTPGAPALVCVHTNLHGVAGGVFRSVQAAPRFTVVPVCTVSGPAGFSVTSGNSCGTSVTDTELVELSPVALSVTVSEIVWTSAAVRPAGAW